MCDKPVFNVTQYIEDGKIFLVKVEGERSSMIYGSTTIHRMVPDLDFARYHKGYKLRCTTIYLN